MISRMSDEELQKYKEDVIQAYYVAEKALEEIGLEEERRTDGSNT